MMKSKVVLIEIQILLCIKIYYDESSFFDEINYLTWGDFRKQFRHRVRTNTEKIITSICKGNTMKQDILNSKIHLTSTEEESPLEVSVYTSDMCTQL